MLLSVQTIFSRCIFLQTTFFVFIIIIIIIIINNYYYYYIYLYTVKIQQVILCRKNTNLNNTA